MSFFQGWGATENGGGTLEGRRAETQVEERAREEE